MMISPVARGIEVFPTSIQHSKAGGSSVTCSGCEVLPQIYKRTWGSLSLRFGTQCILCLKLGHHIAIAVLDMSLPYPRLDSVTYRRSLLALVVSMSLFNISAMGRHWGQLLHGQVQNSNK